MNNNNGNIFAVYVLILAAAVGLMYMVINLIIDTI
jgi:hypothetical protein